MAAAIVMKNVIVRAKRVTISPKLYGTQPLSVKRKIVASGHKDRVRPLMKDMDPQVRKRTPEWIDM